MNARYQKFTEPEGKTRKSAAAAKPKRKQGKAADKPKKRPGPGSKNYEPDTPEYKFFMRLWWWGLGGGAFFVVVSLYLNYIAHQRGVLSTVLLILAYICIIGTFLVDWFRLRPMRLGTYQKKADKAAKSNEEGDATSGDASKSQ
jgi:hypothetical protein